MKKQGAGWSVSMCTNVRIFCDVRSNLLEHELSLCIAVGQRAEEAHAKEVEQLEQQIMKYAKEQRALIQRFQKLDVVEDAIRELFVQMKAWIDTHSCRTLCRCCFFCFVQCRLNEEDPTVEQIEIEKQALREESILVVLGALHANLQHLWQFKVRRS